MQPAVGIDDPLDGADVQWNPIIRAVKSIPVFDKLHVEARLSGVRRKVGRRQMFVPRPWKVNRRELAQMVAPCLVQTLDAYFNALVLQRLHDMGADNIIAIHDSWFVPAFVKYFDREGAQLGQQALASAIESAGEDWLSDNRISPYGAFLDMLPPGPLSEGEERFREGLARAVCHYQPVPGIQSVYVWFVEQLTGSPYETFAKGVYDRWQRRVAERRWPKFTAV